MTRRVGTGAGTNARLNSRRARRRLPYAKSIAARRPEESALRLLVTFDVGHHILYGANLFDLLVRDFDVVLFL